MRKKLLFIVLIFISLVLLILFRLYQPTGITEGIQIDTKAPQIVEQPVVAEPWKTFTAETFSILLPSLPQHVTEKVPLANTNDQIKYDMYLVQQPVGSTFMISLIHYPLSMDTSNSDEVLDSITKEMLSNNSDSTLVSSLHGQFLGKPSIDNVISNSSLHVYMKAFLLNKTLYVVNVVDQQDARAKEHFEKALASFSLNGR